MEKRYGKVQLLSQYPTNIWRKVCIKQMLRHTCNANHSLLGFKHIEMQKKETVENRVYFTPLFMLRQKDMY